MAFSKKTWVDRWVQFPGRKKETLVSGTTDTYDYERQEGTVFAEGDFRNAANMNDMEDRIETEFTNVHDMYGGTVLWTNSSPTSSFAGQTVTLSETIENYSYYEIRFSLDNNASSQVCQTTGKIKTNCKTGMNFASTANVNRFVTSVPSGTSIVFGNGTLTIISPYSTATDNTRCIPLEIIGYK